MRRDEAVRHVLESPGYHHEFGAFLHNHWAIYLAFERSAIYLFPHAERLSAKYLCERIRYHVPLHGRDGPYKVNNSFATSLAKLCVRLNPELVGRFEFREKGVSV